MENPKIKDEELKQIIDDKNELQKMLSQVGILEAQKKQVLDYGKININLKDGSYEVIKEEAPTE
jgi:hypothetical protein